MLNLLKSPLISSLTINIHPLKFTFLSKAKLVEEKLKLQTSHAKKEDNFFNNNKKTKQKTHHQWLSCLYIA